MRIPLTFLLLTVASLGCDRGGPATAAPQPATAAPLVDGVIQTSIVLPSSVDGCLNQSLKDLGVGATRTGEARLWTVDPRKIHSGLVPSGTVRVMGEAEDAKLRLLASASWKGPLQAEIREEVERRLVLLTERIGTFCDQRGLPVGCQSGHRGALEVCPGSGS